MARSKTRSSRHANAIPRLTFQKLVRYIASQQGGEDKLWSKKALAALQEESETYLAEHFQKAHYVCENFQKRTLHPRHFEMSQTLGGASSEPVSA